MLGPPSAGRGIALLSRPAPGPVRPGVDNPTCRAGPPLGRWHRRDDRRHHRADRGQPGPGCRRLPAAHGSASGWLAGALGRRPRPAALPLAPLVSGPLWAVRPSAGCDAGADHLSRRAGPGPVCGHGRPCHAAPDVARDGCHWPDPRFSGPRRRLAPGTRRLATDRRLAGRLLGVVGGRDLYRQPGVLRPGPAPGAGHPL